MKRLLSNIPFYLFAGTFVYSYLYYSETGEFPIYREQSAALSLALVFSVVYGTLAFYANRLLNGKVSWKRSYEKKFIVSLLINYTLLIAFAQIAFRILFPLLGTGLMVTEWFDMYNQLPIKFYILGFFTLLISTVIDFSIFSFGIYSREMVETEQVLNDKLQLQYLSLRSQLNPHFLFNSLNTISSLIFKNAYLSEKYIRKFAGIFRFTLESHTKTLVKLHEELKLVQSYVFLMRIRYEDGFDFEHQIPAHILNTYIPPLTIQLLIENALKHNHITETKSLKITLTLENNKYLVVRNNILGITNSIEVNGQVIKKPLKKYSYGIGLENIKKRYRLLSNDTIEISKNDFFTVKIPVINESRS